MLTFIYAGDTERQKEGQWHRWPFVYLHGMAERINMASFEEGGEAPDICLANEPMDNYVPCIGNLWRNEVAHLPNSSKSAHMSTVVRPGRTTSPPLICHEAL